MVHEFIGADSNAWEKTFENLELKKGTTITLIFFPEGDIKEGHYDFKITKA